jgi:hypothetical protein
LKGFNRFDDAHHGAVMSDHADRRDADLLIDPLSFTIECDGKVSYWG